MIKNVIFDFGQVLVRFDPNYMVTRYVTDKEDAALLEAVVFDRLYWDPLDAGTISDEEVVRLSKERLPERLHEACKKIYYNWIYNIPEIDGMRELLTDLRDGGCRLYLLSNICTYFASHSHEIPMLSLLDGCVFSSTAGAVKPDREIFDHLLKKFSLAADECIFVDDRAENIEGGERAGIRGYVFDGDAAALRDYFRKNGILH